MKWTMSRSMCPWKSTPTETMAVAGSARSILTSKNRVFDPWAYGPRSLLTSCKRYREDTMSLKPFRFNTESVRDFCHDMTEGPVLE